MGTEDHKVSLRLLKSTALPASSWFPGSPGPWYWLPLKMKTRVLAEMPVTGSRIVLRGSKEAGMCQAFPMRFTTRLFPWPAAAPTDSRDFLIHSGQEVSLSSGQNELSPPCRESCLVSNSEPGADRSARLPRSFR